MKSIVKIHCGDRASLPCIPGIIVLLLIVSVLPYSNTLHHSFHFDDFWNITDNNTIRIESLAPASLLRVMQESLHPNRPVAYLSFALNYYADSYNVEGYHLVNIAVHTLTAIGYFLALLLLLRVTGDKKQSPVDELKIATIAAIIWTTHPVHVQAVTYIVQRMTSMAAMFTVWAGVALLWGIVRGGAKLWTGILLSMVLTALAMGSKEIAVIFPVMVITGLWLFRYPHTYWWQCLIVLTGTMLAGLLVTLIFSGPQWLITHINGIFTPVEGLLTVPRALFYNLGLWLWPAPDRLSLDHFFPFSASLVSPPATFWAIAGLGLVGTSVIAALIKDRLVAFGLLWFFILFLAEALVVKNEPVFEHRLYLPDMGLTLCLGVAVVRVGHRFPRFPVLTLTALIGLTLGTATYIRNMAWENEITLGRDMVIKAPEKTRPYYGLITALVQAGNINEAQQQYGRLMKVPADDAGSLYWQGLAARALGYRDQAKHLLSGSLALDPGKCYPQVAMAEIYMEEGKIGQALTHLQAFRGCNKEAGIRQWAIRTAASITATAVQIMRQRIQLNPLDGEARLVLAGLYINSGDLDKAAGELHQLLAYEPDNAPAWTNLGFCEYGRHNYTAAEEAFMKAINIAPGFANPYYGLARVAEITNKFESAVQYYRQYLNLAPKSDAFRMAAAKKIERLQR